MLRWGPQPRAGVYSVLLHEFPAYTLEELKQANYRELIEVLDYRRARLAIDLFNGGEKGFEELAGRPDLMQLLLEMGRAQAGVEIGEAGLSMALARQKKARGGTDG